MAPATTTAAASSDASPTAPRRRSERQLLASPGAATAPPFKKPPRRSSKTDPTVKPLLFWTAQEVANLVQAWCDTIANPPERARSSAGGFNARMYKRFVELCGGSTIRALQSAINKKQLLNNSFQFISQYNERRRSEVAAKASGATSSGGNGNGSGTSSASGASASGSKSGSSGSSTRKTAAAVTVAASKGASATTTSSSSKDASSASSASSTTDQRNYWFELTKAQRKGAAIKSFMTEQRQFALLNMDRATYESMLEITKLEAKLNVRQPWSDDEMALMFRAWREALTKRPKGSRNPLFSLNTRTYEFMAALGGSAFKRTKQSVVLKKEAMRLAYEFIGQFNAQRLEAHAAELAATPSGSGSHSTSSSTGASSNINSAKKKPVTWFQLSQREQERIVAREFPKSGFVYFTEAQYRDMETLFRDTERLGHEHGVRQGVMWTPDENVLLVKAWRDVAEKPLDRLRANATFGACVYERFMHLAKRAYKRSERSTVLKLVSMERMHAFIDAYNDAAARESRADWFSLARPDRKRTHIEATRASGGPDDRARTFTDFDRSMFAAVTKILARNRPLSAITHGAKAKASKATDKRSSIGSSSRRRSRGNDSDDESDSEDENENEDDDVEDDDVIGESPDGNADDNGENSERDDESESDYAPSRRSHASNPVRSRRRLSLSKRSPAKSKAKAKRKTTTQGKSKATTKAKNKASDDEGDSDNDSDDPDDDDANGKGSDGDSSEIDGLQTSDDEDVASAGDDISVSSGDHTASNSFLQVRHSDNQQHPQRQSALPVQSSEAAADGFHSDNAFDQDDDSNASDDDDGDESVALHQHQSRHDTAAGRSSTNGRNAVGRKTATTVPTAATAASTPTAFSLHELADLAMRVNTTADDSSSSSSDTDARADDHDAALVNTGAVTPEPGTLTGTQTGSTSAHKKRKLGSDLAAIVHILQTQSAQMTRVMEEIRDEIRRDRVDRERFREEMRLDREERRRDQASDDDSDRGKRGRSDDDSDERSSGSSSRSKKKHKSARRLSVQRDGFVVRL